MPLFGPPNIEKLKERGDVDGLIRALGHKDWRTRREAAVALGELDDVVGFPKTDWGDDPDGWPKLWPYPVYSHGLPVRRRLEQLSEPALPKKVRGILDAEEEPVAVLKVTLEFRKTEVGFHEYEYRVRGERAKRIALDLRFENVPKLVEQSLWLCITNARLIVAQKHLGGTFRFWPFPLEEVRKVQIDGAIRGNKGGTISIDMDMSVDADMPDQLWWWVLAFDFGDDDPLRLVSADGLESIESGTGLDRLERDDDFVPAPDDPVHMALVSWVDECNRHLARVHAGGSGSLYLYTQYMRGVNSGGLQAVESLIPALDDEEEQVCTSAIEALERIGGPEAEQALAEYRMRH